ncbi:MAG: hypothetical protein JXR70_07645 [Spirochaetales bacterium]|nr:hypothetical protein [Spirochaetales bacterium]
MKHFIEITDFSTDQLLALLDRADTLRQAWKNNAMPRTLNGKRVALWFFGNGFRNRLAFEIGARAMGAEVSYIPGDLGTHEPLEDIGHYLKNWFNLAIIRCKNHNDLAALAAKNCLPIINGRTNFNHPCEILGDLQYIRLKRGSLDGLEILFVGELTNLCMSWMKAASRLAIRVVQAGPRDFLLSEKALVEMNKNIRGEIAVTENLESALSVKTDILYTDCWPKSLIRNEISDLFLPYQIQTRHLEKMNPQGFFLPCPPVTRGEEVSAESLKHPLCQNYEAKDCLLHSQNAIMEFLVNENG